jgi:hypothetical protein
MSIAVTPDAVYKNRFRHNRLERFLEIVDDVIAAKGSCRILDIGGRVAAWTPFSELIEPRPIQVTLVNMVKQTPSLDWMEAVLGDARDISCFGDNSFDVVYSNSVIEHVGPWGDQKRMAAEVCRLARRHFVQTPNFWFPIEPHFRLPGFHWLPEPWRLRIVQARACGFYPRAADLDEAYSILSDARLLTASAMGALFPDSTIVHERVLGLTKSLIAVRR